MSNRIKRKHLTKVLKVFLVNGPAVAAEQTGNLKIYLRILRKGLLVFLGWFFHAKKGSRVYFYRFLLGA